MNTDTLSGRQPTGGRARQIGTHICLAALLAFHLSPALAQDESDEPAGSAEEAAELDEIQVTVERRDQLPQDIGGTIAVFDGEDLTRLGVRNLTDLTHTYPGLEIGNQEGNLEIFIRGVGSNNNTELGDPAAATHIDGTYIPRPRGIGAIFFDIERVEVNVGPQGTLRGRNATAGTVNIVSKKPELGMFSAGAQFEQGNFDATGARAMLNIPIGQRSALRWSAGSFESDSTFNNVGPVQDIEGPEAFDERATRLHFYSEISDRFSILLSGDYIEDEGTGFTGVNFQLPLTNGVRVGEVPEPRDVVLRGFTPRQDTTHWGASLKLDYRTDWFNVESQTSFRDLEYDWTAITPLTPVFDGVEALLDPLDEAVDNFDRFQFITDSESFIQEIRLYSDDSQRFRWNLGGFYFDEDQATFLGATADRDNFFSGNEFNQPNTDTESISGYFDGTFDVTPATRLTGGLRYTSDEKERVGVNSAFRFAMGGAGFTCCLGLRIGTEGFEFAGQGRTIFNPDLDGDGEITPEERLAFFLDGVARFGQRDNVDDAFENGVAFGPEDNAGPCIDTISDDGLECDASGNFTFGVPFGEIVPQRGRRSESFLDWRGRIEHDLSPDKMLYFLVSKGSKAGGFNDNIAPEIAPEFEEETVILYEFGSKNDFRFRGLPMRMNFSAFWYDYEDQQFTALTTASSAGEFVGVEPDAIDNPGLVVAFNFNARQSRIRGFQLDSGVGLPANLRLDTNLLFLDTEFTADVLIQDFRFAPDIPGQAEFAVPQPIKGNELPRSPKWQFNARLSHWFRVPGGTIESLLSLGYRASQHFTVFNGFDFQNPDNPSPRLDDTEDGFVTLDLGIGYAHESGHWRVELFGNNLTDETVTTSLLLSGTTHTRFFNQPRRYGVRLVTQF